MKSLSRLILMLSLSVFVFPLAEGKADAGLFQLPSGWYKARFQTAIKAGSGGLLIHLHQSKKDIVSEKLAEKFQLISPVLNKAISAANTENPFKNNFSHIYTQSAITKRLSCPVYGVRLEVDDDPKSKEWLIIFSAKKCLEPGFYGTDAAPHQWILQRNKAGDYRVLMEAESEFSSLVTVASNSLYKQIHNTLDIAQSIPESDLKCGSATFVWQYSAGVKTQSGHYDVVKTKYETQRCQSKYPSPGLPEWEIKKKYLDKVKKVVGDWKQRLLVTRTHNAKGKGVDLKRSSLIKKPEILHPVFSSQELRVIERLLRKP